jgi:hypothetical protein
LKQEKVTQNEFSCREILIKGNEKLVFDQKEKSLTSLDGLLSCFQAI